MSNGKRKPVSSPVIYALIMVFVSVVVVSLAGIWYTDHVARQNNQKWCALLITVDNAYAEALKNPNISPSGRRIGEEFHRLRIEFRC